MTSWQPLSVRTGQRDEPPLVEGVPVHLRRSLIAWMTQYVADRSYGADKGMEAIALRLQIDPGRQSYESAIYDLAASNPERFLDALDMSLLLVRSTQTAEELEHLLAMGGSAWTVAEGSLSLERRVSPAESAQYQATVTPSDVASEHLKLAWASVYGRHPDPSSAWDDCIKACEAVLKPIVTGQPTMGGVVGTLRGQPQQFTLHLSDNARDPAKRVDPMQAFEQVLHFIWVNPDRHQGADHRVPSLDEARAVLHLSITVVEWARTNVLTKP